LVRRPECWVPAGNHARAAATLNTSIAAAEAITENRRNRAKLRAMAGE